MTVKEWQTKSRLWNELAAVRDVQWQPDRLKGPQLTLRLFDRTATRTAKMWKPTPEQAAQLLTLENELPPLLRVSGTVTPTGDYAGEVTLDSFSSIEDDEEIDLSAFIEPLPEDHDLLVGGLDRLILLVTDPHLAALLQKTIGPGGPQREAYITATAAKGNHHAYRGGLLRHSLEVAEIALHTTYRFPDMHRDLLLTAALLHDIGKLWEMAQDEWQIGQYTGTGNLLGHIYLGGSWLERCCRSLKFPDTLREALLHLVLSHHDRLEHGSPVRPLLPEAIALAKSDQISAELTQCLAVQQEGVSVSRIVYKGDRAYLGARLEFDRIPVPSESLPDDPEERLMHRLQQVETDRPEFSSHFGPISPRTLPILGVVAAGDGIRSTEESDPEERAVLLPPGGAHFFLRVTGDSMIGAGILEDDLLLVRRQEEARLGQIVIAVVPGIGPVVKRLTESTETTVTSRFLTSENPAYAPIPITSEVRLQGVVVRVEREM
jgi:3'-5' exoribonuclease